VEALVDYLFSYGTLRDETVQRAVFGRGLEGFTDALRGFRLANQVIADPTTIALTGTNVHRILIRSDDPNESVEGVRLVIEPHDLASADEYEDAAYVRIQVTLASGADAWVYVKGPA
jgi:gamma-glutamylcyclotransferase (GGCT)/AIG2-like uncharacterized protein YtfP